jgi:HAD superfamily hydrolase (TIGR01450 family)
MARAEASQSSLLASELRAKRHFVFDLDGCIWFGREAAPGAAELVAHLKRTGRTVSYLTNLSTAEAPALVDRLAAMGIEASAEAIVTPLSVLAKHPAFAPGKRVLVVGRPALREALARFGAEVVSDPARAELVVLGSNPELTFADLTVAARALDHGAPLLALNLDRRVPIEGGTFMPGAGALAALLETATGVEAQLIGKPSVRFFEEALRRFGVTADEAVMVGDTPETDIAGGKAVGMLSVLVGEHQGERDDVVPDVRVGDLWELAGLLGYER